MDTEHTYIKGIVYEIDEIKGSDIFYRIYAINSDQTQETLESWIHQSEVKDKLRAYFQELFPEEF